ncbi:hypothetical protein [Miltoncostaea oceani]|uniref:hypothetical protein n=1 Tax=Miltoncostaea oceani TaxID=2843216 RepID=UPI001C3E1A31|nr:hypothetical protein [Miltoncostaea oceani]
MTPGPRRRGSKTPSRLSLPLRYARVDGVPADAERLSVERINVLRREGRITCLSCGEALTIRLGPPPHFSHSPGATLCHDPPSPGHQAAVNAIANRLGEIVPSAQVQQRVEFPDQCFLADVAAVSGRGLRLAVEVQETEMERQRVEDLLDAMEDQGVALLWMRSASLLTLRGAATRPTRKATLGPVETALLSRGRALMYVAPDQIDDRFSSGERLPKILLLHVRPEVIELARAGDPKLGQVDVVLRRYPLSQLRLRAGSVCVLTDYDPPLPELPPFPENLRRRLDKLHATPRLA